jgi:GTP pyrophosphokinase
MRLALQLLRMRGLKGSSPEETRRATLETREIYAPLANRLGIWQVKWELEDLAFRFSQPEEYKRIAGLLQAKRTEREQYIEDVKRDLRRELEAAGISGEVSGRPKHIYSIWRKMQRKSLQFEQVMDVLAVRIMVDTIANVMRRSASCTGCGRISRRIRRLHRDARRTTTTAPLHTAVIGPGQGCRSKCRSARGMHAHAELGVAAHWQYKEGPQGRDEFPAEDRLAAAACSSRRSAKASNPTCSPACRRRCSRTASTR